MDAVDLLLVTCAVGSGIVAGVFFAFSTSVMRSLGELPPEHGIAAMQTINRVILNPLFLGVFLGTAAACVAALTIGVLERHAWIASGAVFYLIGSFGVTMLCNVPRNNAMARLQPGEPQSWPAWRDYVRTWTRWNHVRTAASLAAAASFTVAGMLRP